MGVKCEDCIKVKLDRDRNNKRYCDAGHWDDVSNAYKASCLCGDDYEVDVEHYGTKRGRLIAPTNQ